MKWDLKMHAWHISHNIKTLFLVQCATKTAWTIRCTNIRPLSVSGIVRHEATGSSIRCLIRLGFWEVGGPDIVQLGTVVAFIWCCCFCGWYQPHTRIVITVIYFTCKGFLMLWLVRAYYCLNNTHLCEKCHMIRWLFAYMTCMIACRLILCRKTLDWREELILIFPPKVACLQLFYKMSKHINVLFSPEGHTWGSHEMWRYRREQNRLVSPLWVERMAECLCPKWQQVALLIKLD